MEHRGKVNPSIFETQGNLFKLKRYKLFEFVKAKKITTRGPTAITKNKENNCKKVSIVKTNSILFYKAPKNRQTFFVQSRRFFETDLSSV